MFRFKVMGRPIAERIGQLMITATILEHLRIMCHTCAMIYRHTLEILPVQFQTTTKKQIPQ